jgi:hypothetical protein
MNMNMTERLRHFVLTAYGLGLRFYPAEFRAHYAGEMLRCGQDMLTESCSPLRTARLLVTDLFRSLLLEQFDMTPYSKALPQLAMLLTLTTFIAGPGCLIAQQVLRMSANDPQIQLAEDGAQRLSAGEDAVRILPERQVDRSSSLAPFVIVYDDAGRPIASSARLDGSTPRPPKGVFDFGRANREERVTWQPRPGIRIAAVVTRSTNGFVVAGRNMREVEERKTLVLKLAATGWLFANVALTALWLAAQFLGRARASQPQATA